MSSRNKTAARGSGPAASSDPPLGFVLADLIRLLRSDFRQRAAGLGLTPALSRLLFYVQQRPGCTQAEIAGFLDVTSVTVGRMIDRLEKSGFVRRRADARDRRAFRIHLGQGGRPIVTRMQAIIAQTTAHATRGMPRSQYRALRSGLELMRTNLETRDR